MNWTAPVDIYCERLGPGFWAEPLNAVTNASFLIAAFICWRMAAARGRFHGMTRALILILATIGVGSFLFHTFAERWAGAALLNAQLFTHLSLLPSDAYPYIAKILEKHPLPEQITLDELQNIPNRPDRWSTLKTPLNDWIAQLAKHAGRHL